MSARPPGHFDSWAKLIEQDRHGLHGLDTDAYFRNDEQSVTVSSDFQVFQQPMRLCYIDGTAPLYCGAFGAVR